jgi:hypothetical protein
MPPSSLALPCGFCGETFSAFLVTAQARLALGLAVTGGALLRVLGFLAYAAINRRTPAVLARPLSKLPLPTTAYRT